MENSHSNRTQDTAKTTNVSGRIQLEPSLEIQAATLNARQCRALADVYERWTRQLRVKAKILELDSSLRRSKRKLKRVPPSVLHCN